MKPRILLDSSVWIEWLTRGKRLQACQRYMDKSHVVGVPALVIFEVCRKVTQLKFRTTKRCVLPLGSELSES